MYKEIKPNNWYLSNRIGYNEKIFKTFRPNYYFFDDKDKLKCKCDYDKCDIDDKKIGLYPQQRLIKDYMQFNNPYRGVLLYHELGAGKSGASIAAAEGYINKKKVFVLSPASLAVNYENEIKKMTLIGIKYNKDWTLIEVDKKDSIVKEILLNKYSIDISLVKSSGKIWIPFYDNDIPNAEIIKKEVSTDEEEFIELIISHIIKNRYRFISYNGLTKKLVNELGKHGFDNSIVVIDEVHNFASRIVNGSILSQDIYSKIMDAKDCKVILLSGTPIINNPYEIATIINLIRGYMIIYELTMKATSRIVDEKEIRKKLITEKLYRVIDELVVNNENKILFSLLPYGYKRESRDSLVIIKKEWELSLEKTIELIGLKIGEIRGIILEPKINRNFYSALPNTKGEFNEYFIDMKDEENPEIKNKDLFLRRILGSLSYYSISGSELFPSRNPDVIHNLYMTDTQIKKYLEVRAVERKMESGTKGGVMANKSSVYRAFSRMVCNFTFPETIERLYPKDVKKLLKKELEEQEENNEDEEKIKKKEEIKVGDVYDEKLQESLKKITTGDHLLYDNVKNSLSPKFGYMYDDIENSKGSVLIYSQFRSVEGLGLFSEFLIKNGYIEINLKKVDGEYTLINKTNVFDSKYDNKRFVIFDQDKKKTKILMNLFNGEYDDIPSQIYKYLPDDKNQLYGKLVKIFCITASGAEGISLKNVRSVLLMEPYWNNIRIEQVIGRAIRSCSHELLPKEERNVTVYKYLMKFTKEQLDLNYSIQTVDKGLTTDEHISMMANKKMRLIEEFLKMLKSASFDCIINAKQNKPLKNLYKCYNWAIGVNNNELSYTPNIKDDYKILTFRKRQIAKKGKGKVIIKNGIKYVLLDGKIYNYHSYTTASILIPEEI